MKLKQEYILSYEQGERLRKIQSKMAQEIRTGLQINDHFCANMALNNLSYLVDELEDILAGE